MNKLFIVTRADLPPGAIAAQSVHAGFAFAHEHQCAWRAWSIASNNIVLLSVPDELALLGIARKAEEHQIPFSVFREPDLDDSVTAVAIGPSGWRLVSSLPLALRLPAQKPRIDLAQEEAIAGR